MLGTDRLGSSPKTFSAFFIFALAVITVFSLASWPPYEAHVNASIADTNAILETALEGRPRIRQACMLFVSKVAGEHEMGKNVIYERSIRTHIKHAERWGYVNHILREDIIGMGEWKVLVFGKLLYLQSIIVGELSRPAEERAEWIVWFDADTIILNDNIPWSIFLPPQEDLNDIHFLGTKDWTSFNCGVFFLRITEWSVQFLMAATGLPLLRPDVELANPVPNMEQNAMAWVLAQEGYKEHAIYQPRGWYNGFYQGMDQRSEIGPGDLLVHFPGVTQKFNAMARYLDKLEAPEMAKDFQIPLTNMTLQADINGFWSRVRRARDAVGRAEAQQHLLKKPSLGDKIKKSVDELKRILLEEAYNEKSIVQATLAVEAALKAAAEDATIVREVPDDASDRHLESQKEPTMERWNELRMSEKLGI